MYNQDFVARMKDTNQSVDPQPQLLRHSMDPPPALSYGDARNQQMQRMSALKQPWTSEDEHYYNLVTDDTNKRNERLV